MKILKVVTNGRNKACLLVARLVHNYQLIKSLCCIRNGKTKENFGNFLKNGLQIKSLKEGVKYSIKGKKSYNQ